MSSPPSYAAVLTGKASPSASVQNGNVQRELRAMGMPAEARTAQLRVLSTLNEIAETHHPSFVETAAHQLTDLEEMKQKGPRAVQSASERVRKGKHEAVQKLRERKEAEAQRQLAAMQVAEMAKQKKRTKLTLYDEDLTPEERALVAQSLTEDELQRQNKIASEKRQKEYEHHQREAMAKMDPVKYGARLARIESRKNMQKQWAFKTRGMNPQQLAKFHELRRYNDLAAYVQLLHLDPQPFWALAHKTFKEGEQNEETEKQVIAPGTRVLIELVIVPEHVLKEQVCFRPLVTVLGYEAACNRHRQIQKSLLDRGLTLPEYTFKERNQTEFKSAYEYSSYCIWLMENYDVEKECVFNVVKENLDYENEPLDPRHPEAPASYFTGILPKDPVADEHIWALGPLKERKPKCSSCDFFMLIDARFKCDCSRDSASSSSSSESSKCGVQTCSAECRDKHLERVHPEEWKQHEARATARKAKEKEYKRVKAERRKARMEEEMTSGSVGKQMYAAEQAVLKAKQRAARKQKVKEDEPAVQLFD